MNFLFDTIQIVLFLVVLTSGSVFLGGLFYKALIGERNLLSPILLKPEKFIYKIFRIDEKYEMDWKEYLKGILSFSF